MKLILFTDDTIIYVENPIDFTKKKKLLEISEFSTDVGYKISIQRPTVFLYTSNGISEIKIIKRYHFQ